jgi:transposase
MSTREHERAVVFARVVRGELQLRDAAELVQLSERQAKRVLARFRGGGWRGLVHGNVGRRSNRARPVEERARILELVRTEFGGPAERGPGQRFGPTLAAEHLEEEFGIAIAVRTLGNWMVEDGLWSRARKVQRRPRRRERRGHFGELVQLDGSFHDWYEGRGARAGSLSCVMNMVDDATGETLLRFGDQETIWAAVHILQEWIRLYGVPRALYTDWKNIYKRAPSSTERNLGVEAHTPFGLMCEKLGIRVIGAGSPQAKGRIERSNGVHQDRLIKKMRRLGIEDDAAANVYVLQTYLPAHNARFAKPPRERADYHLPPNPALRPDDVYCIEHRRVVGNDFVVQFEGEGLQLDRRSRGRVPSGSRVLVRQTEDGRIRVIHCGPAGEHECRWTPAAPRTKTAPRPSPDPRPRKAPQKPAPDHPWRSTERIRALRAEARKHAALTGPRP